MSRDPYNDDEWDDDDWDDYRYERDTESSYNWQLIKADNGQMVVMEGILTRYPGEDWGEASGWHEEYINLSRLLDHIKTKLIADYKDQPPGVYDMNLWAYADEDEEDEDDEPAHCSD